MTKMMDNPLLKDRAPAAHRVPQGREDSWTADAIEVVSADCHWEISSDIFYERFPRAIRDKAPRVWFDRYWHLGYPDLTHSDPFSIELERRVGDILELSVPSGAWDLDLRTLHMDAEGVSKEIIYPQSLLGFLRHPDLEVQEAVYRIYNDYIAEVFSVDPGRHYGVGVFSNWWDPDQIERAMQQIVDLGLKTFMIPTSSPGNTIDGRKISYGGDEMDRFWSVVAEAKIPVSFHIGENPSLIGRGAQAAWLLQAMSPFRKPLGEMIFGGVFDRHPDLQVVFAEGGLAWIPAAIQDAEMILDAHYACLDYIPKERPSQYWHRNCFATFQTDPIGLNLIEYIGADRIMWASDYPHNEGTFGYNWTVLSQLSRDFSPDQARQILGQTAAGLYRL